MSEELSPSRLRCVVFLLVASVGVGCAGEGEEETASAGPPQLETRADSLSMHVYEFFGGPEAWEALPYLRFDFGIEQGGRRRVVARHLWNRQNGDYRVEWSSGSDSTYVAHFNVNTREGQAYLNGETVPSARNDSLLKTAYRRFINDTYWLLAPVKLFDSGVQRTYAPDSSTASTGVLKLTFGDVGLTPDDRYWIYANKKTGRVERWAFVLQGQEAPRFFTWTGYERFNTPAGSLQLATRKEAASANRAILTDAIELPEEVPKEMFTDPGPRLE